MTVGSTVCPSSDVSPPVMVTVQTVADVTLSDTFQSSVVSRIVYTRGQLDVYIQGGTVEVQNPTNGT
jgi:hypothetical protein